MNLEDHIGDIIRKARGMSKISPEAAAKAAEVSPTELAAIEESGKVAGKTNFMELAELIGLDGSKLQAIAGGWLPAQKDLSAWRELRCFTTTDSSIAVNCYLIWDEVSR